MLVTMKNHRFSLTVFLLLCLETSTLSGDSEDYVADSEDEATKNFKGRVCSLETLEHRVFMGSESP